MGEKVKGAKFFATFEVKLVSRQSLFWAHLEKLMTIYVEVDVTLKRKASLSRFVRKKKIIQSYQKEAAFSLTTLGHFSHVLSLSLFERKSLKEFDLD